MKSPKQKAVDIMDNNSMVVSKDGYTTGLGPLIRDIRINLLFLARFNRKKHIIEIVYSNHHHIVVCYVSSSLLTERIIKFEQILKLCLAVSNIYRYLIWDNRSVFTAALTTVTNNYCGCETSLPTIEQSTYHGHMMLHGTIVEEAIVLPIPTLCCDPSFDEMYTVGEVIGDGGYALVRAGYRIKDHARVAIKVFDRKHIDQKRKKSIRMEYNILTSLNHDGVVRALGMYEEPDHTYIVMEYAEGGDLLDRIIAKECYLEGDAKSLMLHLLDTVKYLHDNDIVHG